MMRRYFGVGLCLLIGACGANEKPQVAPTPPPAPARSAATQAPLPPRPIVDPVELLVGTSQRHFESGERELAAGHLDKARAEFDRAVGVLLEAPYGARTDARRAPLFTSGGIAAPTLTPVRLTGRVR